jgi:hypothetical protein
MAEAESRSYPRFNHVALTVPSESLNSDGREALLDFYGEVFGWTEMPTMTRDGELLTLRCYSNQQFVYIHAHEHPMRTAGMEHIGMSVETPEELDGMYERARKYAERDSEVDLTERGCDDFKVVKLHNFYVRYRLPLQIEIQCFEWAPGANQFSTG